MFRKMSLVCCLLLLMGSAAAAQDSLGWQPAVDLMFTLTQNVYSDNWSGGDLGSVTWAGTGNFGLQRQFAAPWHWRNQLKLAYGQTHNQDGETKDWFHPFKSSDLIDFESLLRWQKWTAAQPYVALRVITQFEDARIETAKLHLNPLNLTESVGAARQLYQHEDDEFLARLGFGLRQLINREFVNGYSQTRTVTTNDGGLEFVLDGKYKIPSSSINWTTKLTTFKALFNSKSDEFKGESNEDYWQAIDLNWENTFSAQLSKYLAVSLYVQWLYDKEIDLGGRFKETMSLNLTWKIR